MKRPLGYGLVGCGSFGRFCLEQYSTLKDIKPRAVADTNTKVAESTAEDYDLEACSLEDLLKRRDTNIIHIATPPSTHYELVMKALKYKKHVLCEKPLATRLDHAKEMLKTAKKARKVLVVNFVMRYNSLCTAVKQILDQKLLGKPLHGYFENYAKDEDLPKEHWFWKKEVSGGIFIEHGVHFFDLFKMWLGQGEIRSAQQYSRENTLLIDQANCTINYQGVPVNFYHGFHQPSRMDRQEFKLVCERGDICLHGWIPTDIKIDCLGDSRLLDKIKKIVPNAKVKQTIHYIGRKRKVKICHKDYKIDARYIVQGDTGLEKLDLYAHLLRTLLSDQIAFIRNRKHKRKVTEKNGIDSLKTAVGSDNKSYYLRGICS